MVTVDFSKTPVVDAHAHPFYFEVTKETDVSFLRKLSLSVIPEMFTEVTVDTNVTPYSGQNMWMQILLRRLSQYYGVSERIEEIIAERNKRTVDYESYTKELFNDVGLKGAILDFGYPQPTVNREEFMNKTNLHIDEIVRIEKEMIEAMEESPDFYSFITNLRKRFQQALKKEYVVGLKTIIAYRSGLDIGEMNEQDAQQDYSLFVSNNRAVVKSLRDYCFHMAMEECTKANKFFHIHTGIGDGEVVLPKASPSFLLDLFRTEQYKDTKVHLVHGGYPWMEEAAFIVSILPNVYMDISLQVPFTGHGVKRVIQQVLEMAPFDKVMYGSDAFTVPEMYWMGVDLFKSELTEVLNEFVEKDFMTVEKAQEIGEMLLYKNYETVYGKLTEK